jgi:hypothetical protein
LQTQSFRGRRGLRRATAVLFSMTRSDGSTAAITGGTGVFEGVSGQIDNDRVASGVVDRTFHLLPRHH